LTGLPVYETIEKEYGVQCVEMAVAVPYCRGCGFEYLFVKAPTGGRGRLTGLPNNPEVILITLLL
jgi:hypothetical protein